MKGEAQLQSECIKWFRLQYPQYRTILFAIPNGGSRNILEAANLKKQGVVAGIPDLFLAYPYNGTHGTFIEMKYGGNMLTENQKIVITSLRNHGYGVAVCNTFDEFRDIIQNTII